MVPFPLAQALVPLALSFRPPDELQSDQKSGGSANVASSIPTSVKPQDHHQVGNTLADMTKMTR
ncbi:hypothetical protein AMTR_s00060p00182040 [Amborella trichopoda]|uniref:Uncharacterized protein n=1 Tax=Amborella trichopoda TaxID=13333 RepID=W1NL22_AMBTC|nr:hypothetical protein AMTR_s00060p00182040 [Amborella trichopoda]